MMPCVALRDGGGRDQSPAIVPAVDDKGSGCANKAPRRPVQGATMAAAQRAKKSQPPAPVLIRLAGDAGPPIGLRPDTKAFQSAAMRWS